MSSHFTDQIVVHYFGQKLAPKFLKISLQSLLVSLTVFLSVAAAQTSETDGSELKADQVVPFTNITSKLPQHSPVPGGIAIVPLNMSSAKKPRVKFGSRDVLVIPLQDQWQAIVGLPGDILPGNYILGTVDEEEENGKVPLQVLPLAPPVRNQSAKDEQATSTIATTARFANPIQLESSVASSDYINLAMTVPREIELDDLQLLPSFLFAPIMESEQLVPYGSILSQNKIETHHYLGYLGTPESQVYAPAPGVVVKVVEDEDYSGLIYIHHGGGIVSLIGNLEKISVQEGQILDRGEQIGRADFDGSLNRGRVDFGLSLNGFLVDPLQFPSSP